MSVLRGELSPESVPVVILARMSSARVPGKALLKIGRNGLLETVVTRVIQAVETDRVAVATSIDATDDAIADWCAARGILCLRGSLHDVSGRFLGSASEMGADSVVRISGDSPFIDPELIDHAIRLYRHLNVDLVTNVFPRTFPKGQSVEVIRVQALRRATETGLSADQQEHVTKVFYDNPDIFQIVNFATTDVDGEGDTWSDYSSVQLSIDTEDDVRQARLISEYLSDDLDRSSWRELAAVWQKLTAERST